MRSGPEVRLVRNATPNLASFLCRSARNNRNQQHNPANKTRAIWFDSNTNKVSHGYAVKFAQYREAWTLLEADAQHAVPEVRRATVG